MIRLLLLLPLWLGLALPCLAVEIDVGQGLVVELTLEPGWAVYQQAPAALVDETAEHIAHEEAAKNASAEQIRRVAEKRLAANEAIIYHAASGSHLDIDFSPLAAEEAAPRDQDLEASARFAEQSLETEEGVHDLTAKIVAAQVPGARTAYRLNAAYRHHEEPVEFIGIIGFAARQWFYLYFTSPGKDPKALVDIEKMLGSLQIKPAAG